MTDLSSSDGLNEVKQQQSNTTLMMLTTANGDVSSQIQLHQLEVQNLNNTKLNKELQFLQKAINEAGLTDFYQTLTQSSSNDVQSPLLSSSSASSTSSKTNYSPNCDANLETILQMQCELIDLQKELKTIEYETMDQLKMLHQNLNRLSKKFDNFENTILNYTSQSANVPQGNNINNNNNNNRFIFQFGMYKQPNNKK